MPSWVKDENTWDKAKKAADKNKNADNYYAIVTDIYKKMEHKQHVYEKPDTYTGSCEPEDYFGFIIEETQSEIIFFEGCGFFISCLFFL